MVSKQKILIVDDDNNIAELISLYLTKECFDTMIVNDGESVMPAMETFAPNLILLDLMLPGIDGYQVCREVRAQYSVPIIMLSAKGEVFDKVLGLELGADDYMEKPFHLQELEARIRSLTRRKFVQRDVCLNNGDIRFDTKKREAYAKEERVPLTRKESGILEYLLLNQGRPVSQEELIEHVWDASVDSFSGAIRVHMSSLRKKLKAVLGYDPIVNKVGEGYKMREESEQ